jgi:hypothetical protein
LDNLQVYKAIKDEDWIMRIGLSKYKAIEIELKSLG